MGGAKRPQARADVQQGRPIEMNCSVIPPQLDKYACFPS